MVDSILIPLFKQGDWSIVQFDQDPEKVYVTHNCAMGECLISREWGSRSLTKDCWSCKTRIPDEIVTISELHSE